MRRRYTPMPEPRADGFVVGGLAVVIALTFGAFFASEALVVDEAPIARAYTLALVPPTGPAAGVDPATTASVTPVVEAEPIMSVAEPASADAPICNVAKCAAAFKSFNVDDCTFQPFDGERRVCGY
jgi:hypothetical protein